MERDPFSTKNQTL